ncbi:MAG: hypothetical protein V1725_00730 [archaeon]
MKVGLYDNGLNCLVSLMHRELERNGHAVRSHDCVCRYGKCYSEDVIVIHPSTTNTYGCWDKIRDVVLHNREKQFYVFAYGSPERKEYIGEHENLVFIDGTNFIDVMEKLLGDLPRE